MSLQRMRIIVSKAPSCPLKPGTSMRIATALVTLVALLLAWSAPTHAQRAPKSDREAGAETPGARDKIVASGLRAVFPTSARCPEIASPYASRTRYDGSRRPPSAPGGGLHGGIDVSLAEDTPLLALAAGTVVGKGEGGMMEGIFVWLRHAPEDTGVGYWVHSKYQHLVALPELAVGARVALGQTIGRSGATGTMGRHYGAGGYPHLHLTTRKTASGDTSGETPPSAGILFDPVSLYHDAGLPAGTDVVIPYATPEGVLTPASTRVIWPMACTSR